MDLDKRTYVDGSTVITAQNLNDIQDAIIDLEQNRSVPTSVREAIYTLLENAAYITTGLDDELAVVEAWAEQVYSLTLNKTSLSLNQDTPQTITATVVPADATVSWSSSDDDIATVSNGVVTGVSNGTCVITATAGALSATCNVTVSGFVTLSSISAVYTQSGTVYDTDSLDNLKADLVVTATYSDSSTATIPSTDYTLSGTLTVGTSTITVAYSGKTDTFNVTVTDHEIWTWQYSPSTDGKLTDQSYVYVSSRTDATDEVIDGLWKVTIPQGSSEKSLQMRFGDGNGNYTVTQGELRMKVKFDSLPYQINANGLRAQLSKGSGVGAAKVILSKDASGNYRIGRVIGTSTDITTIQTLSANTWYVVDVKFRTNGFSIYLDGTEIYTSTSASTVSASYSGLYMICTADTTSKAESLVAYFEYIKFLAGGVN